MPDTILGTVRDIGTITAFRELTDMLLCHGHDTTRKDLCPDTNSKEEKVIIWGSQRRFPKGKGAAGLDSE